MKIVETTGGSVTSTKNFVWSGVNLCEERDSNGSLTNGKQFFPLGQINFSGGSGTSCFDTIDHLGSTREMTDGSGNIMAQYGYDPYGNVTKLQGGSDADFQYVGMYMHARSGLNLTLTRAYNPDFGRWINRDPIEEDGGVNLYAYVDNSPTLFIDPFGLAPIMGSPPPPPPGPPPGSGSGTVRPTSPETQKKINALLQCLQAALDDLKAGQNLAKTFRTSCARTRQMKLASNTYAKERMICFMLFSMGTQEFIRRMDQLDFADQFSAGEKEFTRRWLERLGK